MFGTELVKSGALRAASPAEKSLGAGKLAHSAAMAGLRPFRRGSRVPESAGSIEPIIGSLSQQAAEQAGGTSGGDGFGLKSRTPAPASRNFRMPALRASEETKR